MYKIKIICSMSRTDKEKGLEALVNKWFEANKSNISKVISVSHSVDSSFAYSQIATILYEER